MNSVALIATSSGDGEHCVSIRTSGEGTIFASFELNKMF